MLQKLLDGMDKKHDGKYAAKEVIKKLSNQDWQNGDAIPFCFKYNAKLKSKRSIFKGIKEDHMKKTTYK